MNDLLAFLNARLDEDERDPGGWPDARVLAEVDAKRRIISWHDRQRDDTTPYGEPVVICYCGYDQPCATLRLLALPYADHPDYREEWRP